MSIWRCCVLAVLALSSGVLAAQDYRVSVLIDSNGQSTGGCAMTTLAGSASGLEARLTATVSGSPAQVVSLTREVCTGGVFSAPVAVGGGYPVGRNNGLNGADVVELAMTEGGLALPVARDWRIAVATETVGGGAGDFTSSFSASGLGGTGIPLAPQLIPTLSPAVLALTAALFALALLWMARRQRGLLSVLLLAGSLSLIGVAWAANYLLDGEVGDWDVPPLGTDPAGELPDDPALDIVAVFAARESGRVFFRVDLADVENLAPQITAQAFAIDENAPAGSVVGAVVASDPNASDTLAFAITGGNGAGAFAIDPASGTLSVASSAALDFETTPAFTLTVQVTDNGAIPRSASATVTITLNDVNEAPSVADQAFAVDENAANGSAVGSVLASDPDAGDSLTFAITGGNTGGAFAIAAGSGAITVANSAAVALANSPFSLAVSVTDSGALSDSASVTVSVNDLNDAPTFDLDPYAFSVAEDAAVGAAVGSVSASDADAGDLLSYSIVSGNPGGAFAIDAASGAISVATTLDFETTASYSLTVQVIDDGNPVLSDTATVNISVTDVNEAPLIGAQTFTIDENAANGTAVGTVLASDADSAAPNNQLGYAITAGNPNGAFAIDAGSGALSVANSAELDREALASFALTVVVTDGGTPALSASATITVQLNDLNDNAPVADDATLAIDENLANGTVVATVAASDADATAPNSTLGYAITGGSGATAFAINASTGAISVADSAQLDREATTGFSLTVLVSDGGTPALSDSATITLNLNDLNDNAPVADNAGFTIAENTPNGTTVGTFSASDADATAPNNTLGYAISGGSGATAFAIDPGTGAITVADAAQLDAETNPTLVLNLTVSDGGTPALSDTAVVTLTVSDVNEAPVVNDQSFGVDENSPNGSVVGTLAASDPDATAPNNTLAYAITGGSGMGVFALDAGSGQITVTDSSALDVSTNPSFTLEVSVSDGGTPPLSDSATVTITVNDVNEAPSVADQGFSIAENSANGSVVGNVVASDPDASAPNNTLRYAVTGGSGATAFALNSASGQITVADSAQLNFEVTPSFTLDVTVTDQDGAGLSDSAVITIDLNDVAEPPTAVDDGPFALLAGETFNLADGAGDLLNNDELGEPAAALVSFGASDATASPAGSGIAFAGATLTVNANGSLSLSGPSQPGTYTALYRLQNADGFSDGSISFEIRQPPAALADSLQVNVTATLSADLFADNGSGADTVGVPAGSVLSIGGGDLGGDVSSFATPASRPLAGGTLTVGSDGALSLVAPTDAGSFSFSYRLGNVLGTSDAQVTIVVLAQANDDVYEVTPQLTLSIGDGVQGGRVLANDALGSAVITGFGPIGSCNAVTPNGSNPATTGGGGRVVLGTDGSFSYIPPAGLAGNGLPNSPEDAFCYTITGGDTATVGFEFANTELVWFVDAAYAGANGAANGTQGRPFTGTAAADAVDTANDRVFIAHNASAYACSSSGWTLLAGTRLIGEAYVGTPSTVFGITPVAGSALPAGGGSAPTLSGSGVTCITLAAAGNNQLRGLSIGDTGLAGTAIAGTGFGTLTVAELTLGGSGRALSLTNGTLSGSFLDLDVGSGSNEGIRLDAVGGTWSVVANVEIGNVSGTAVSVQNAPAGSSLDFSAGLTISKTSAGTGLLLNTNAGSASFGALNVSTGAGTAIDATASPLSASSGTISATGGPAILASGVSFGTSALTSVSSVNSSGAGISLTNSTGSLSMNGGSVSGNAAGSPAFLVSGSAGTAISYAGSLSKTNAGRLVEISGAGAGNVTLSGALSCNGCGGGGSNVGLRVADRTGGTIVFSGSTQTFSTGTAGGVQLGTNSAGTTIQFSGGGLSLTTTSGAGLSASGSGTLAITGTGNAISTATGTALSVVNTTIAAGNLNFRSVSAGTAVSGPTNGIVLNNTGSTGGLTVSGTGSAGTGGWIRNATGDGVSLTSTRSINLSWMDIDGNDGSGVAASTVTDLALANLRVRDNTDALFEAGIRLVNLSGSNTISNTEVAGSTEDNISVLNNTSAATLTSLAISGSGCLVRDNSSGSGNVGINIQAAGNATMNGVTVDGCTLYGNRSVAIRGDAGDSSSLAITVRNNVITAGAPNQGNQGIEISAATDARVSFFDLDNNRVGTDGVTGSPLLNTGINVSGGGTANCRMTGRVRNNQVFNAGVAASGFGIRVFQSSACVIDANVSNNQVSNVGLDYGLLVESGGSAGATGGVSAALLNNTVSVLPGALDAIRVQARKASTMCARVSGNTTTHPDDAGCSAGATFCGLFGRQVNTAAFNIEGCSPGPLTAVQAATCLAGQNAGADTVAAVAATGFFGVAPNSCSSIP